MENKMTQRDYFNEIIALAKANDRPDIVTFAEGRIAVLDSKVAKRKPAKDKEENIALVERIREVLTTEGQTATEVLAALNDASLSNQKVSAMLKQMTADGTVVKTMDKKKALWTLA